ncbi:MAG TPA: alpha/beta hydrolase [Acidimicrobiales bacterium]|nr:alpha/beta hydrolase [Acidimicrobiales bacterium]
MFLAVSMAFAILVVNALVPVRREPLTVASFALGWIPSELPLQVGAVEAIVTVAFAFDGALRAWPGWVALAVGAATGAGWVELVLAAHRSKSLVDRALADATGGAISVDGLDPIPAWNRWWRLVIAVPFRFRGIRRTRNVDYWGDGNYRHKLDILTRRSPRAEHAPVLVYIHGGAWVIGDKRQQGIPMMHELVQRGWVCVAVNYRLSPRATWPAHIVDCKRAVAWVREHIAEYGGDPDFIAVSGGSAGGHLSSLLALTPNDPEWQPGFEDLDASVDACLPFYGVYDMTVDPTRSGAYGPGLLDLLERRVMKTARSDNPALFEQASPDRRVTSAAPPMFVFHGTNDTLVPPAVGRYFADRLRQVSEAPVAYVELPRAQHAFDVMASIRSRHTTMGAVQFLEGMRLRVAADPTSGPVPG